jgi:hypothetical protein
VVPCYHGKTVPIYHGNQHGKECYCTMVLLPFLLGIYLYFVISIVTDYQQH